MDANIARYVASDEDNGVSKIVQNIAHEVCRIFPSQYFRESSGIHLGLRTVSATTSVQFDSDERVR